jgi:hypothetical protein
MDQLISSIFNNNIIIEFSNSYIKVEKINVILLNNTVSFLLLVYI